MKRFTCTCGNQIFFENTRCVSCHSELGWCPSCWSLAALLPDENGTWHCANKGCGARLRKCHNYAVEHVCNRCCIVPQSGHAASVFCDYCRYNDTIPDLSVPGNREMWAKLEMAKRRLLYTLDMLRLPYGRKHDGIHPPLGFDFKADAMPGSKGWWVMQKDERVYTGHAGGKITINLREADTVERERTRLQFQEAHRTVVGHFRHEIGHYYWQMLVQGKCEPAFQTAFGSFLQPGYIEAKQRYYDVGPKPDWQGRYVSAYATMHPWEDFAETFAAYLDIVSVLDTAWQYDFADACDLAKAELDEMVSSYVRLGVVLNEFNRAMGLIDLVPGVFAPPIVAKLQFVHGLIRAAQLPPKSGHKQVPTKG